MAPIAAGSIARAPQIKRGDPHAAAFCFDQQSTRANKNGRIAVLQVKYRHSFEDRLVFGRGYPAHLCDGLSRRIKANTRLCAKERQYAARLKMVRVIMADENRVDALVRRSPGDDRFPHLLWQPLIGVGAVMKDGVEQDLGLAVHDHDAFIGEIANGRRLLRNRSRAK